MPLPRSPLRHVLQPRSPIERLAQGSVPPDRRAGWGRAARAAGGGALALALLLCALVVNLGLAHTLTLLVSAPALREPLLAAAALGSWLAGREAWETLRTMLMPCEMDLFLAARAPRRSLPRS